MDGRRFFPGCFTSCLFRLWSPFFREEHYESRSFSSSFNIFFRRRAYRAAFFSHTHGRPFSPQHTFRVVFFLLDQRPFLAECISSHRLFSARSVLFNIRCYKPIALFSVMFCTTLKYPNFRLIAPSHFKLIACFLIRLVDNFKYFLFPDIYDIHTYMHTLFSHIRFWPLSCFLFPRGWAWWMEGLGELVKGP